jgi:hypothetical protein
MLVEAPGGIEDRRLGRRRGQRLHERGGEMTPGLATERERESLHCLLGRLLRRESGPFEIPGLAGVPGMTQVARGLLPPVIPTIHRRQPASTISFQELITAVGRHLASEPTALNLIQATNTDTPRQMDISPDGRTLVLLGIPVMDRDGTVNELQVVVNWFEELKRTMAAAK